MTERQGDKVKVGGRWRYWWWRAVKWGAWGVVVLAVGVGVWSHFERGDLLWRVPVQVYEGGEWGVARRLVVIRFGPGSVGVEYQGNLFESGTDSGLPDGREGRVMPERTFRRVTGRDLRNAYVEGWRSWAWAWGERPLGEPLAGSSNVVMGVRLAGVGMTKNVYLRGSVGPNQMYQGRVQTELWRLRFPTIYVVLVGGMVGWFAGRREEKSRAWWWMKRGRCGGCGNDLRGAEEGGGCSECGRGRGEGKS